MTQFVDITGGALLSSPFTIDTSQFLTVTRANALYVNEAGDDINMEKVKLSNAPTPVKTTDVTNKAYVDELNNRLRKNVAVLVTEIEKLSRDIKKLVEQYDAKLKSLQAEIELWTVAKYDTRLKSLTEDIDIRLRGLQPNVKHFGYLLDIGTHLNVLTDSSVAGKTNGVGKVTSYNIMYPFKMDMITTTFQVTMLADTSAWKDDISTYIRRVHIEHIKEQTKMTLELCTFRTNGEHHWGLHLHAYLLVSVFNGALPFLENTTLG